ncbi:MAG: 23S rRNA (pseudouridine(1915)-N(3))-methyltransferase RlmH [Bacteroidetes bacterium 4572_112]|nr:MAG: 23S rRNA (pseudouridine(1915)-N(3))-methyltransferase RlmH [Bacteroidetes bacterium 4572_112]
MKLKIILVGKTEEDYLKHGIDIYQKRLKNYLPLDVIEIPALKNTKKLSIEQQKIKEGELILQKLEKSDFIVILDEKGREFSSVDFSKYFQNKMNSGIKSLCLIIGGPYGFSNDVYSRAQQKIALSQMTFSHQMIRLLLFEQCYRAMSILRNEPYHHI